MFKKKKKLVLRITGMKCEGCVTRIENVLKEIKGINNFEISLENHTAVIYSYKEVKDIVIEKLESINFQVRVIEEQ